MNATPRKLAVLTLEYYAYQICLHAAMLASFPGHGAADHWQAEMTAWQNRLLRKSQGKNGRNNLYFQQVLDTLRETLDEAEMVIIDQISDKGLDSRQFNFQATLAVLDTFAQEFKA